MTFTDEIKSALSAKLSSENVRTRKQAGRTLSYLEGWVAIAEANRIFGFDGWTRETIYCKEIARYETTIGANKEAGWKVGYEAKVRVVAHGIAKEGTGHGSASMRDLFDAIESAAKEAETDAMKRAFMMFGNPFGLALYDKTQANVERDGGMTPQADQRMADNISKYAGKPEGPHRIDVPSMEDEKIRWQTWATTLKRSLLASTAPEEVDDWWAKNEVPLGNLKTHSEAAYDYLHGVAESRKEQIAAETGLADDRALLHETDAG